MHPFRKLRAKLEGFGAKHSTKEGFPLPFELSENQYRKLLRLVKSEDFGLFVATLDKMLTLYAEELLTSKDDVESNILKGKILGIRSTTEFVDELKLKEEIFVRGERRRSEQQHINTESKRRTSTFGTPSWGKEGT